jgi:hypothetical protein
MGISPPAIRSTIALTSRATAWRDFDGFGTKVGDRIGTTPRTSDQREDFCVRHFILGLAVDSGLPYPRRVSMLRQDHEAAWPDCLVWWHEVDEPVGLEIVQATSQEWQQTLRRERDAAAGDLVDEEQVVFVGDSEDGWVGENPEREVAGLIADAISAKADGLNREIAKYRGTKECDLLVYADDASTIVTGASLSDGDRPMKTLIDVFERDQRSRIAAYARIFRHVNVLVGNKLIFSLLSSPRVVVVPRAKNGGFE